MIKVHEWVSEAVQSTDKSMAELSRLFWEKLGKTSQDRSIIGKMAKDPNAPGPKPRRVQLNELIIIAEITGYELPDELRQAVAGEISPATIELARRISNLSPKRQRTVENVVDDLEAADAQSKP